MGKCSNEILHTRAVRLYVFDMNESRMPKPIKWIVLPLTKLLRCWFYSFSVEEISVCETAGTCTLQNKIHSDTLSRRKFTEFIRRHDGKYYDGKFNNLIFVNGTYDTHRLTKTTNETYRKSHYNFLYALFHRAANAVPLSLLLLYFVFWSFPNLDN